MSEKKREPINLPGRISFNEFVTLNTDMDQVERAGFRVFCKSKMWMRQAEWEQTLNSYLGGGIKEEGKKTNG